MALSNPLGIPLIMDTREWTNELYQNHLLDKLGHSNFCHTSTPKTRGAYLFLVYNACNGGGPLELDVSMIKDKSLLERFTLYELIVWQHTIGQPSLHCLNMAKRYAKWFHSLKQAEFLGHPQPQTWNDSKTMIIEEDPRLVGFSMNDMPSASYHLHHGIDELPSGLIQVMKQNVDPTPFPPVPSFEERKTLDTETAQLEMELEALLNDREYKEESKQFPEFRTPTPFDINVNGRPDTLPDPVMLTDTDLNGDSHVFLK